MTIAILSPAAGATLVIPERYPYFIPGGVILPPDSGLLSARVTMTLARDVPWAQLNVYLLKAAGGTTTEYCGQNLPDSPTWQSLPSGWTSTVTITGFEVYRLPCDVTGLRAILHTRNSGTLTPPTPMETIAEATTPASFRLAR